MPPARSDSWNTEASTTTPRPSVGGKMNPKSKRTRPSENPAKGPAIATFRRSSRLDTIFTILVIAPNEPICHQNNSLDFQYTIYSQKTKNKKESPLYRRKHGITLNSQNSHNLTGNNETSLLYKYLWAWWLK